MKSKIVSPKKFQPVSIELTFESQAELDAFGCLMNSGEIVSAIRKVFGKEVELKGWEEAEELGGSLDKTGSLMEATKANL